LLKIPPQEVEKYLLPPDAGLEYPTLEVDQETLNKLRNGVFIPLRENFNEGELLKIYCNGKFSAIGVVKNGKLKPEKVFV
jgi:hypothetical protein